MKQRITQNTAYFKRKKAESSDSAFTTHVVSILAIEPFETKPLWNSRPDSLTAHSSLRTYRIRLPSSA